MNTQQIQNTIKKVQRTTGSLWLWLGLGILLFVAALAIQNISLRAPTTSIPEPGAPSQAQSVPEAAVQGVAGYINAHSYSSAQTAPDPAVQSVMDYLEAHGIQP